MDHLSSESKEVFVGHHQHNHRNKRDLDVRIHAKLLLCIPDSTESGGGFCGMRMWRPYNIDVGNADWLLKVHHSNVKMLIGC